MSKQKQRYVVTVEEDGFHGFDATRVVEAQEYRPAEAVRRVLDDLEATSDLVTAKPLRITVERTD